MVDSENNIDKEHQDQLVDFFRDRYVSSWFAVSTINKFSIIPGHSDEVFNSSRGDDEKKGNLKVNQSEMTDQALVPLVEKFESE